MNPDVLSSIIRDYVAEQRSQKILLQDLRAHVTRADPSLLADPTARTRLHHALQCLVDQGVIIFPRGAKGYDRRSDPPLPTWVAKPPHSRDEHLPTVNRVWPHDLELAAAQANRPDELVLLGRIADWLRDNRNAQPVPMEERSLDIFDDEKVLGRKTGDRLFTMGLLSLDLLRCFRTPLPFVSQHVPGVGPTALLVAENNASYHSLLTTAREQPEPTRPDVHIAWGSGRQFPVAIDSIRLLEPTPTALYYFGDLDLAGFQIANDAARAAARLGLPTLEPATALYEAALVHGTPRPDRSNRGTSKDFAELVKWLPERIRPPILTLLDTRNRIPQEIVGRRLLREDPFLVRHSGQSSHGTQL